MPILSSDIKAGALALAGCIGMIAIVVGLVCAEAIVFQFLWNAVIVDIFESTRAVTFYESFLLLAVVSVIASMFRGGK